MRRHPREADLPALVLPIPSATLQERDNIKK